MKLFRYGLQLTILIVLSVSVLWLFGGFVGLFDHLIPRYILGEYGLATGATVLLASGTALGLVLSLPALASFGRKWAAMGVGLAGVPFALVGVPPDAGALAANGGYLAIVGALSCTVVSALSAVAALLLIDKLRGRQETQNESTG